VTPQIRVRIRVRVRVRVNSRLVTGSPLQAWRSVTPVLNLDSLSKPLETLEIEIGLVSQLRFATPLFDLIPELPQFQLLIMKPQPQLIQFSL